MIGARIGPPRLARLHVPRIALGPSLAATSALLSFAISIVNPYFLNIYWQIPDGIEILHGHLPTSVSYAIDSGPMVAQEWLYEAMLAWFATHDAFGLFAIVCGLAAAATPILAFAIVRAFGIGALGAGVAAVLVSGARLAGSSVRPESFAIDAFAIEMLVLARGRGALLLVPTMLLWANVHASVVIAPFVAFAFALLRARDVDAPKADLRNAWTVAGIALAATFVTPHGPRLWTYAIALAVGSNPARHHLEVWKPLAFDTLGALATVLPGLAILLVFGSVVRLRFACELAIAALFFGLTLVHARYETFLVVAWAPVLARSIEAHPLTQRYVARGPTASALVLGPFLFYAIFCALRIASARADGAGPWQTAASIVTNNHLHGNTYAPYGWAAYLHWRALPVRLLIDAHGDPYRSDVWDDHLALQELRPGWRDVLDRRALDIVIVTASAPLAQALAMDPRWHVGERRDDIVAYVRNVRIARMR